MRVRRPRRRRWISAGVILAVLVAGFSTWMATRGGNDAVAETTSLVAASTGTIRQTVTATGTITPARQADLDFVVSGTVTAVSAKVGAKVTKGQVLAKVDPTASKAAVETAQASLDAAEESRDSQEDASDTAVAAANAQVVAAGTKLAAARTALAGASLRSTIAGTVAAVNLAVGDSVSGSGSSAGGSAAGGQGGTTTASSTAGVTIISTDAYIVEASVGSADLASLKTGLQAEITPTGATTKAFGTVSSIGIVATTSTSGTATFPVVIDITGTPTGLYAGSSASVVVIVKQLDDVLTVPTSALHTEDGKTVVHQTKDGAQVSTPVELGTAYGASTEITSGLVAGDEVVVTNVRPGAGTGGGTRSGTQQGQTGQQGGFGGGAPPAGGFGGFGGGN